MKQILLATVAAVALTFPAMAQNNTVQEPNNNIQMPHKYGQDVPVKTMDMQPHKQQAQTMSQRNKDAQQAENTQTQAGQRVDPMQLSKQQVSQIQQTLNKKGYDAHSVDGIWGPETADALRNFQRRNDIQADGHLTQQTLAKLGVNWANDNEQPSTVGAGSTSGTNRNAMSKPASSATTGMGSGENAENAMSKPSQNGTSATTGMGSQQDEQNEMSKPGRSGTSAADQADMNKDQPNQNESGPSDMKSGASNQKSQ